MLVMYALVSDYVTLLLDVYLSVLEVYMYDIRISTKIKFRSQDFQKLEPEQDRHRQTGRCDCTHYRAAFASDKMSLHSSHILRRLQTFY